MEESTVFVEMLFGGVGNFVDCHCVHFVGEESLDLRWEFPEDHFFYHVIQRNLTHFVADDCQ